MPAVPLLATMSITHISLPHTHSALPPSSTPSAGLYMVTTAGDQAVCLWDVNERKCLEKRLLPGCATGVAWHPTKNSMAVITEDGGWMVDRWLGGWVGRQVRLPVSPRTLQPASWPPVWACPSPAPLAHHLPIAPHASALQASWLCGRA